MDHTAKGALIARFSVMFRFGQVQKRLDDAVQALNEVRRSVEIMGSDEELAKAVTDTLHLLRKRSAAMADDRRLYVEAVLTELERAEP